MGEPIEGVNRWLSEFFQSAGAWTWIKEFLVKPKTATLRLSAQPLGQPQRVGAKSITTFNFKQV